MVSAVLSTHSSSTVYAMFSGCSFSVSKFCRIFRPRELFLKIPRFAVFSVHFQKKLQYLQCFLCALRQPSRFLQCLQSHLALKFKILQRTHPPKSAGLSAFEYTLPPRFCNAFSALMLDPRFGSDFSAVFLCNAGLLRSHLQLLSEASFT